MEMGLPNEAGRLQILEIHTKALRESNRLDHTGPDLLRSLAKCTRNYSGAELEGLVKSAVSFALQRGLKANMDMRDDSWLKLEEGDFELALKEVIPQHGAKLEDVLQALPQGGLIDYNDEYRKKREEIEGLVEYVKIYNNQANNAVGDTGAIQSISLSVLLVGEAGAGKSSLAASLASRSGFPFIKKISALDLLGLTVAQKVGTLNSAFEDSKRSGLSMLILEDIDQMMDLVPLDYGATSATSSNLHFSHDVFMSISMLLKSAKTAGRRDYQRPNKEQSSLVILATATKATELKKMGLLDRFDFSFSLEPLQTQQEVDCILTGSRAIDISRNTIVNEQPSPTISLPATIEEVLRSRLLSKW